MIAWQTVVGLVFIGVLLGYLLGRQRQFQQNISERLEVVDQDRNGHQRRTLEKNTLGRFKNAIEATYPCRFSLKISRNSVIGHDYLEIWLSGETISFASIIMGDNRITLYYKGSHVYYAISEVKIKEAIETMITYLSPQF